MHGIPTTPTDRGALQGADVQRREAAATDKNNPTGLKGKIATVKSLPTKIGIGAIGLPGISTAVNKIMNHKLLGNPPVNLGSNNSFGNMQFYDAGNLGVLGQTRNVPGQAAPVTIDAIMTQLLDSMPDPKPTNAEMKNYIAAGEKIVASLNGMTDLQIKNEAPVSINNHNGVPILISSSRDAARAIAWFITAETTKLSDANGMPMIMKSGSTFVNDPDQKIYNFLTKAPSAYNRNSSHIAKFTDATKALFGKLTKQRGIEDSQNKMPGNQGALLFDKANINGKSITFMKFENVGTQTKQQFKAHMGHFAHGNSNVDFGREDVATVIDHTNDLLPPTVARREGIGKGIYGGWVKTDYKEGLKEMRTALKDQLITRSGGMSSSDSKAVIKEFDQIIKEMGAKPNMFDLEDRQGNANTTVDGAFTKLEDFCFARMSQPADQRSPLDAHTATFAAALMKLSSDIVNMKADLGGEQGVDRVAMEIHLDVGL